MGLVLSGENPCLDLALGFGIVIRDGLYFGRTPLQIAGLFLALVIPLSSLHD